MKIVLKGKDNSVAIMELVDESKKDEAIRKLNEIHPDKNYVQVGEGVKMPENREFRDAWEVSKTGSVVVNKTKAKHIHLDRVRQKRNEKLKELDVETLRYLNDGDKLQEVEAKKQVLRDLPKNVDGLNWPKELN